jgi:uncharacterized membrane-anchored protein
MEGRAVVAAKTKRLIGRDLRGCIAVLDHENLDAAAAEALAASGVMAVVNASPTMTGAYPAKGPLILFRKKIPILEIGRADFARFQDGGFVQIFTDALRAADNVVSYRTFDLARWLKLYRAAQSNADRLLLTFIDNTLDYARREKSFVLERLQLPPLATRLAGRHAIVVARGSGCAADLRAVASYIARFRPVRIGVDGGADVLLAAGHRPDLIVGDMDSVSDRALRCGAELIVHAYPDGRAPGLARVRGLGLQAHVVPSFGTSEDVALLVAHEARAERIVALGVRRHMVDFLEKGRGGMGSTLLIRMKLGGKLIDADGIRFLCGGSDDAGDGS